MDIIAELEKLRRNHVEIEDPYYSCPLSSNWSADWCPGVKGVCDCGADKHNKMLEGIIAAYRSERPLSPTTCSQPAKSE